MHVYKSGGELVSSPFAGHSSVIRFCGFLRPADFNFKCLHRMAVTELSPQS